MLRTPKHTLRHTIARLKESKVLENYSYMTTLSMISAVISLIIYPYVIRVTGKDAYGAYAYALTIAFYFQIIVDFGFDSPAAKAIVAAKDNKAERSRILSAIVLCKCGLYAICCGIFAAMTWLLPFMREHFWLCIITFVQIFFLSLLPSWYFQGMKNMKRITIINLVYRLLTLPFIFIFVHNTDDILIYALIVAISLIAGTITAFVSLYREGIRLCIVPPRELRPYMADALPFFLSGLAGNIKSTLVKTVIKNSFGLAEVAIYDLAEKIIAIPRLFTQSINQALFPEVVGRATPSLVRRILRYERGIGGGIALIVAALAYPAVYVLGGTTMLEAAPISMILSLTIYSWLVTGAYLNFVFVPNNKYYYITRNQIVALVSCLAFIGIGLWIEHSMLCLAVAISLSGLVEVVYCRIVSHRMKLL